MKTAVYHFDSIEELQNIDNSFDSNKTLIQIFCAKSDQNYIQNIQQIIHNNFPRSVLIGATSDGTIAGGNYYEKKSVIIISKFENTFLKTSLKESNVEDEYFQIGSVIAQELIRNDTKVIITFADGISINGEEYINGISSVNNEIIISGGMAADDGNIKKTYVFDNTKITSCGMVAVSLSGKDLHVNNGYSFDWMPIGKEMEVTKAVANKVYEIDGKSVIDIYAKYLGKDIAKHLPKTGIEFPLVFDKNGISIGRAVIGRSGDALIYAGNLPEKTKVRFGIGNISLIVRDSDYSIESSLKEYSIKPEAIFIYSCMARRRLLGRYIEHELKTLEGVAKSGGFFTYGEFYNKNKHTEFFNETLTFLMLAEGRPQKITSYKNSVDKDEIDEMSTILALANLANVVSQELESLNKNLSKKVEESTQEIYTQAYYDKLTGLPNRLSLIKKLEESVGDVIFLVNVDDFTSINDFYGHAFGDKILQELANVLKEFTDAHEGELFRLPSDEFVILLKIPYKRDLIDEKIHALLSMVDHFDFKIDGIRIYVRIAVSTACNTEDGLGLAKADASLKIAKKSSKAYIINDDGNILKKYEENLKVVNLLNEAIENDRIIPYYQPIYDAKTQKIVKYEALVRLKKNATQTLLPGQFLEISKKIRLYHRITKIMIKTTCQYFSSNPQPFSLNLAFEDILNRSTREYLIKNVTRYNVASLLTIEILETTELTNETEVLEYLKTFSDLGIKIAIDDFGSGFANFEYLTKINASYIKLDGSIIKNIDKDQNSKIIVETVIGFAQKMGMKTIAEFVHSKEVYEIVRSLGVDYVQGYYFAQPKEEIPL